jgi:hypothetical protein
VINRRLLRKVEVVHVLIDPSSWVSGLLESRGYIKGDPRGRLLVAHNLGQLLKDLLDLLILVSVPNDKAGLVWSGATHLRSHIPGGPGWNDLDLLGDVIGV